MQLSPLPRELAVRCHLEDCPQPRQTRSHRRTRIQSAARTSVSCPTIADTVTTDQTAGGMSTHPARSPITLLLTRAHRPEPGLPPTSAPRHLQQGPHSARRGDRYYEAARSKNCSWSAFPDVQTNPSRAPPASRPTPGIRATQDRYVT